MVEATTTRLIERVANGSRAAYRQLFSALLDWWDSDREQFDSALNDLALSAAGQSDGAACELLLSTIHQLGLARPAILRLTVDPDVVNEVAESTLVQIERNLHRFEGRSTLRTWMFTIARNETLMHFRREDRHAPAAGGEGVLDAERPAGGRLSSVVVTRATIRDAVASLPEPYGETMRLRLFDELSYEEIAECSGIPIGTVRSRIAKSRDLLAEKLGS